MHTQINIILKIKSKGKQDGLASKGTCYVSLETQIKVGEETLLHKVVL